MRADGDAGETQRHRPGEEERADVVAAAEVEHGTRETLERLRERDAGGKQQRHGEP